MTRASFDVTDHPELGTSDPIARLVSTWDRCVAAMLEGETALTPALGAWFASMLSSYPAPAFTGALPEPFLGALDHRPAGVFLGPTPGRAYIGSHGRPDFHSATGVFAQEMRALGSYSAWAASGAYLRPPWTTVVSTTGVHRRRLLFLRHWHGDDRLSGDDMVTFSLYPWHSTGITSRLRAEPDLARTFVFDPIVALGSPPVFTFGPPWFTILPALGFTLEAMVGFGKQGSEATNRSRAVALFRGPGGLRVIAERHPGSPYPPPIEGVTQMQKALANEGVGL
jgi:hypothetical protein